MTPSPGGRRLATVTIPAPDLRPEPFLRSAPEGARGFWAKGDRWVAHRGVAAEFRAGTSGDRFDEAACWVQALVRDPVLPADAPRAPRVLGFGGFAFRSDHEPRDVWRAFPAARFQVPAFELEGEASGDAWLRARALVSGEDAAEALARLRRSAEALRAELASLADGALPAPRPVAGHKVATDRRAWERAVEASLGAIRGGAVSKVVLARTLDVDVDADPVLVAMRLWEANPETYVFLFQPEEGAALVGAAPETVATLRDGVFHATAVAGSIRRGDTPREQAELAARLLASDKDRHEHRIALDDMVARLATVTHQIRTDPQPHVLTLARIQHLETEIRASVPAGTGVLDLVRLLHPTAAVCGLPRDAALSFLAGAEPFHRGWYAGPVGWMDGEGNGMFAPALRSAVLHDGVWRLFAGAGIVEGSVPSLEWEETAMKFTPVLEALAASGVELAEAEGPRAVGSAP
ncbi:MAG: isochorismate synthase [Longimicrobiales bacterium]